MDRDSILHMEAMEPGNYCMLIDIDWQSDLANKEIVFSSYGADEIIIYCNDGEHETLDQCLTSIFSGYALYHHPDYTPKPFDEKKSMDIVSKSMINNEGYFAIIIENKSKTQKLEATYTFK